MIGIQTLGRLVRKGVLARRNPRTGIVGDPDVKIGGDGTAAGCYMQRWWIIPRNKYLNIYLHKFQHDDTDLALHDHPWKSCSVLIEGDYFEHTADRVYERHAGDVAVRGATAAHRVSLPKRVKPGTPRRSFKVTEWSDIESVPCWTIFITGPKEREWGFHCPKGWKHWLAFSGSDHNKTGVANKGDGIPGCGED